MRCNMGALKLIFNFLCCNIFVLTFSYLLSGLEASVVTFSVFTLLFGLIYLFPCWVLIPFLKAKKSKRTRLGKYFSKLAHLEKMNGIKDSQIFETNIAIPFPLAASDFGNKIVIFINTRSWEELSPKYGDELTSLAIQNYKSKEFAYRSFVTAQKIIAFSLVNAPAKLLNFFFPKLTFIELLRTFFWSGLNSFLDVVFLSKHSPTSPDYIDLDDRVLEEFIDEALIVSSIGTTLPKQFSEVLSPLDFTGVLKFVKALRSKKLAGPECLFSNRTEKRLENIAF